MKGPGNEKSNGSALARFIPLGSLALLPAIVFANSLFNGFALDDVPLIAENRLIRSLRLLPTIFGTDYWAGSLGLGVGGDLYRPLVISTFAVNYALGRLNPVGYHLLNLLLHIGACWALYFLGRALGLSRAGAIASASLFAVHPIHTEAVSNVVGRAEILMALATLLSIIGYIQAGAPARFKIWPAVASWIAFSVGLLSKEQAIVLPALLLLWDVGAARNGMGQLSWKRLLCGAFGRYASYLLILAAYLVFRSSVLQTRFFQQTAMHFLLQNNPLAGLPWNLRLLTALKVAGKYLWLFLWPAQLSADYSYDAIPIVKSIGEPEILLAFFAWAGLGALGIYGYVRKSRPLLFGIGCAFLTYLPVSNLFVIIGTIMAERLFYLPSAGLCLVIGAGMEKILAWEKPYPLRSWSNKITAAVCSVLLLLLSARSIARNRDWRSTETIFRSALQVVPRSAKVQAANGQFLLEAGQLDGAIAAYQRALAIDPNYAAVYINLGRAYARQSRWSEAEAAFRRGLEIWERDLGSAHPAVAEALNGFAELRYLERRYTEGEAFLERALAIWKASLGGSHPAVALALSNLASFYIAEGRYAEAEPLLKRALAIREAALGPEHPAVKRTLEIYAGLLRKTNRIDEATSLEAGIRATPDRRNSSP